MIDRTGLRTRLCEVRVENKTVPETLLPSGIYVGARTEP